MEIRDNVKMWTPRVLRSAAAGAAAAGPMGLAMIGLNKVMPDREIPLYGEDDPLPPKEITAKAASRTGSESVMKPGAGWEPATWLAHLGYGGAVAGLYPIVTRWLPVPSVARGMLFALGVWAASYMGWLPAANILPPASRQPARRNAVMILSHLVWGAMIGLGVRALEKRSAR